MDVVLDLSDPFDRALKQILDTNRKKRRDYASDGDPFENFRITSYFAGFEADWLSALFMCQQKLARLHALRNNGRMDNPDNESVKDTVLDNAVYGVIAYSMLLADERPS